MRKDLRISKLQILDVGGNSRPTSRRALPEAFDALGESAYFEACLCNNLDFYRSAIASGASDIGKTRLIQAIQSFNPGEHLGFFVKSGSHRCLAIYGAPDRWLAATWDEGARA